MSLNLLRYKKIIKYSNEAYGNYKKHILILLVLGFVSGILEGVGVNALIPLFSFAAGDSVPTDNVLTQLIHDFFRVINFDYSIKFLLIFIFILFVFKAIILFIFDYISIRIVTSYETRNRTELFNKFVNSKWDYLVKQKLGYLENVIMNDVRISAHTLLLLTSTIMFVTGMLTYVVIAINISWQITAITLAISVIVFLVFRPLILKIKTYSQKTSNINKSVAHFVNENILGLKSLKALNVVRQAQKKGEKLFIDLKKLRIKRTLIAAIPKHVYQPVGVAFISVLFVYNYKASTDGFSLATLVAMIYLIQRILMYSQNLQAKVYNIYENIPYIQHVLKYRRDAVDYREKDNGKKPFVLNKDLRFDNISFAYENDHQVLKNIDFTVNKGEMVGLIGPSGAGKTTIVDLLLGLLKTKQGEILLDGVDINDIALSAWRGNIGYVSQDIFLLNGSIAENIKFYDPGISDEKMIKSAKQANIYDLIQSFEQKFDTQIGDRGLFLSAGQRQRIVIARILAREPQLLILDEATSALDNESEVKIQEVIDNLKGKMTVIVIAHRLSTVNNCDKLMVLDKGNIIEQGSPVELMNNPNSYFYKVKNLR